ncbi:ankyrin repeat domain-containing protein [Wolbachia endosymbiont of Folsomia candida]|uniref:ankyrin repeat domain-containing protein n=1 Tax=Wolbachia endosymbiont of Folsomia candida TaxID=169402 RepID=UPI000A80F22E|nr:ankyrin repeat domain-containing protein [Wolbachia endosymbiont of Folsomia candida]APR98546.1 hypothetical protein ASM33_04790 [Wolbachia endosymbiont of Folsomia candida]APR98952.1 hypothetical protein ASM33_07125 [Wolbachia endosymbiont of Folsomia candida]
MVDENRKNNQLFLETIKEIYFDDLQVKNSMLPDLVWGEKIVEWLSEEVVLTENQYKLDQGLLIALSSINCSYLELYNASDFIYDRAGTKQLEEFLNANKNDPDLQVVLNLRRGEGKRTVLEKMATRNISAVYLFLKAVADPNIGDKKGKTPLHCAAKYNNLDILNILLEEKSIDINVKDENGKTPLHYAVFHGHNEVISRLLTEEAIDINAQDNEGKAPLHHATFWEVDNEMIDILVKKGAKIDIQDYKDNTPLHYAANVGYIDSVGLLTKRSDNVNLVNKDGDTALHIALNNKDERVPEAILENAKNIDVNIKNKKGESPLLLAAGVSTTNIVEKILAKGANIDKYCLHNAAKNVYAEEILNDIDSYEDIQSKVVDQFISLGCEVNAKDEGGSTPLFYAVEHCNNEVAKQLVHKGADTSVRNKKGYTVFEYAVKTNSLEALSAILPHKIDECGNELDKEIDIDKAKEILTKIIDNQGNTLLHWTVRYGCDREILNFLVESGIDINAKNKNGVAPIHIAAKYGREDLIEFFIEKKARINVQCGKFTKSEIDDLEKVKEKGDFTEGEFIYIRDSEKNIKKDIEHKKETPISIAAGNNHGNTVGMFLSNGAKANISDSRGWTPIYIAIRTACDKSCKEEEREKAYRIVEKLAMFSDIEAFKPKGGINQIVNGLKKAWTGKDEESFLVRATNDDERMRKILEKALRDRENDKLPNAPVDEYVPSAPPLDDSFFGEIGSYVEEIPELYPDLAKELEESYLGNLEFKKPGDKSENKDQSIEQKPDKKSTKQKTDSINKIRLTFHDKERLNIFSDKVAKSKDIAELNQVVSEALKSGVRLNFLNNKNNSFTDVVMQRIQVLKENSKISSNIICNLVSRGADINSYEKINQELEEVFKDHKTNIQKAYLEANKRINDFHEAVANATTGKIELIEIDNTTFYLEYSADSTVDVAKAVEAARGLGLYDGNIVFGSNIVKIGESEIEIETKSGIRNYTDLSDNGDVIITFQTSLGELDVRLYNSTQYKDSIEVEVCDPEKFNQLVNIKEEIGKNCLFGGLSVYDAIEQGYFERSGKLQFSETISCKRSEPSETVSFISQDIKEEAKKVMENIGSTDIKNTGEESWLNRMQGKRTNEGCGRGM